MLLLHNGTVAREYGGDTVEGHEAGDDCADEIRREGTGRGDFEDGSRRDGTRGALRMEAAGTGRGIADEIRREGTGRGGL